MLTLPRDFIRLFGPCITSGKIPGKKGFASGTFGRAENAEQTFLWERFPIGQPPYPLSSFPTGAATLPSPVAFCAFYVICTLARAVEPVYYISIY
jgi:hypothetical protein